MPTAQNRNQHCTVSVRAEAVKSHLHNVMLKRDVTHAAQHASHRLTSGSAGIQQAAALHVAECLCAAPLPIQLQPPLPQQPIQ